MRKDRKEEIIKKWEDSGLLNGLTLMDKDNPILKLIESVDKQVINELPDIKPMNLEKCNELDDRVAIKLDGNIYLVKPIISFSQLKKMIGADNDYYKIECINRPERWEDKIISNNEFIDLNQPDCKNLEFICIRK